MTKNIIIVILINLLIICIGLLGYVQFVRPNLVSQKYNIEFDCGFGMPAGCENADRKYKELEFRTRTQYILPLAVGLGIANVLLIILLKKQKLPVR